MRFAPVLAVVLVCMPSGAAQEVLPSFSRLFQGETIGAHGLAAAVAPSGVNRIVSSADDQCWIATEFDAQASQYRMVFQSPLRESTLRDVTIADLDGDGTLEILTLFADGLIRERDFVTFAWKEDYVTSISDPQELLVVEINPLDPEQDMLVLGTALSQRLDASGGFVAEYAAHGESMTVGQVDGDSSLELITTGGQVVDLKSGAVQWSYPAGFGVGVATIDTDGDLVEEIVAGNKYRSIDGFDAVSMTQEWTTPFNSLERVRTGDFDADGSLEIMVAPSQSNPIQALDPLTRNVKWELDERLSGVADLLHADFDQNGDVELVFAAGFRSTGEDRLFVVDPATDTVEWRSYPVEGPFHGPFVADLDGDGMEEVVLVSSTSMSQSWEGLVYIFDAATLQQLDRFDAVLNGHDKVHACMLADPDGDGRPQIFLAGTRSNDGWIHEFHWSRAGGAVSGFVIQTQPNGEDFRCIAVTDLEGDGSWEIVVGSSHQSTAATGPGVLAYSYPQGQRLWRSPDLADSWRTISDLITSDVDGDGVQEIFAGVLGGDLLLLDAAGNLIDQEGAGCASVQSLASGPYAGAAVVGEVDGQISVWTADSHGLSILFRRAFLDEAVVGVESGVPGLLLIGGGGVLRALRESDFGLVAESAPLGGRLGRTVVEVQPGLFLTAGPWGMVGFSR